MKQLLKNKGSIGAKLRKALLPPFILAALIMSIIMSYLTHSELQEELEVKQKILSDIYATALTDSVWNLDQSGAEAILAALSLDPDVSGAIVREQFSGILATVGRAVPQDPDNDLLVHRDIRSDIEVGAERIGQVSILFHRDRIEKALRTAIIQAVSLLTLTLLLLSISVRHSIDRYVSRPLTTLLKGIKRTEDRHERDPIKWEGSPDEFSIVIDAFNHMIERLSYEEREMIRAKNSAEQANKAKSVFLATMSHELRTPLNGITGMAQLMEDTGLNDRQRNYLLSLRNSGEVLLNLVNDILDFSKIEAGAIEIDYHAFPLHDAVATALQLVETQAKTKGLETQLSVIGIRPDDYFWGDGRKITQILTNLLSNAVKFTEKGTITVTVERHETAGHVSTLNFEVQDTGIGIPSDRIRSLFQAFTQIESSISRRYEGSGLGLAISQGLINAMGGTDITVNSALGEGSLFTFTLSLPTAKAPQHSAPSTQDSATAPSNKVEADKALSILVVEDNKINRTVAKGLLERLGHTVTTAEDGQQGLEKATKSQFDLIMMDIHMPVMNGLDATKAIRNLSDRHKATTPILALTADVMQASIEEYSRHGMQGYVAKPVRKETLINSLQPFTRRSSY